MRRLGAVAGRIEQYPCLGLAERRAQVIARPVPTRVGVHRHRASRREQLDQDAGDRSPALREGGADHLLGQRLDYVLERHVTDARQVDRAHALGAAIGIAVIGGSAGAHPVF